MRRIGVVVVVVLLCMSTLVQGLDVGPKMDAETPLDVPEPSCDVGDDIPGYGLGGIVGHFTENRGQVDDDGIRYYCIGSSLSVAFGTSTVSYDHRPADTDTGAMFRVHFEGANQVVPKGIGEMNHRSNYFIGDDPEGWVTGAQNYRKIVFTEIYEGIDLCYHFSEGRMKYDFIVAPGGDPRDIAIDFEGIEFLSIDERSGDLIIATPAGTVTDQAPVTYQITSSGNHDVDSAYEIGDDDAVHFQLGTYDESLVLVIDPGLEFSTLVGGSKYDSVYQGRCDPFHLDDEGNVYVCGYASEYFPTTLGAYDRSCDGDVDAYVFKLSSNGSALEYSTYLGGSKGDIGTAIIVDDEGSAYIAGMTDSNDFPTTSGVLQRQRAADQDATLTKLNADGSSLVYSTYIGGQNWDQICDLSLNPDGSVYLTGYSDSGDFPLGPGGYQTTLNGRGDSYILKVSSNASKILHGTFFGGSDFDVVQNLVVHRDEWNGDEVYICGGTKSDDLPVKPNSYRKTLTKENDMFIAKFNHNLSFLLASTYMGTFGFNSNKINLDSYGDVFVVGRVYENGVQTTPDALQKTLKGPDDIYLAKLDPDLTELKYGTYFGGSGSDGSSQAMACLEGDEIVWVFETTSNDLETTIDAFDRSYNGGADFYIARFDSSMDIKYATYLGGSDWDSCAENVHHGNNTTVVGITESTDFPTTQGAYQRQFGGVRDIFVTRLWTGDPPDATPPSLPRNLTAEVNETRVILSWDPPADHGGSSLKGYYLYRDVSDTNMTKIKRLIGLNTYYDSPTADGTTYYYAVSAFNVNEGNLSNIVNVTVYGSPRIPGNLSATPGCNTVTLTWDPPENTGGYPVLGYRIFRGTITTRIEHIADIGNVTRYVDGAVENGRTYLYQVLAFTEYGDGPQSGIVRERPVGGPGPPFELRTTVGNGTVTVMWMTPLHNGGEEIIGYKISRGFTEDRLFLHTTIERQTTTFTDTGLENAVTYYYTVQAINKLGDSPRSMVVNATPYGPPSPPESPVAIEGDNLVILHWGRPIYDGGDPVFGYVIYRGTNEDEIWGYDAVYSGRMYIDYNVTIGETYYYRITATNWGGESEPTDVIPAVAIVLPGPPGRLEVTEGNRFAELRWTKPSSTGGTPVLNYTIYRGESPDTLMVHDIVGPSLNRYIDVDVEDGMTYYYTVTVTTKAGEGPASDAIPTTPLSPPGPPMGLVATPGDGEVELGWSSPAFDGGRAVWGYIVYRGDTPETMEELQRLGITLSFTDEDVENDRTYYYAVAAYNSIDNGPPCDAVPARPYRPMTTPGLVRNLLPSVDGTTVTLQWDTPLDDGGSEVMGYVVMRGLSSSNMEEVAQVGIVQSYTDEDLQRGKTYFYKVAARNAIGRGDFSATKQVSIDRLEERESDSTSWLLIVAVVCACIVTVGAIASTESGRYRWGLLLGPLTTRLKREEVLDNKTRHALLGIIITNPGIHYQAIMREFELKNGVAAYHLDVLEREEYIRSVRDGRLKRFYSTDTKVPKDQRLTPDEVREAILALVDSQPGITKKRMVNELGIDGETVRYHLRVLVEQKELRDAREGRHAVYFRDT